ncbi:acid-sensing ion channel 5 [Trichonephila inaurata madagascariensis]|uniref:Acid-sensing ion channel 5 n=1 Tax=Trichonephila inaurata madagascariensis TaxID=2747483 RepID=A0A8X6YCG2_9ARAC|nr:acid-sensing ion channel 5 [Trichonephila inaurata madagascariensis]
MPQNNGSSLLKNSSVYAISRMCNSQFSFIKILWFLLFIVSFIGSSYRIKEFYSLYQQYPTVVSLRVDHKKIMEFPAVSICNLNRRKDLTNCGFKHFGRRPDLGTPLVLSESRNLISCSKYRRNVLIHDRRRLEKLEFLNQHYGMNKTSIKMLGHKISNLLQKCSFDGKCCRKDYLSEFVSFRYGNCFTFNKKIEGRDYLKISSTGFRSALILLLNLEVCSYQNSTEMIGAVVTVHTPEETPNPEEDGFIVSPGYEVSVSLKQTVIRRLPAPYRDRCMDYKAQAKKFLSKNECIRSCIQDHNFAKCNCINPTLAVKSTLKTCSLRNVSEICCLDDVLNDLTQHGPVCDCPLPCKSVYFNKRLSHAVLSKKYVMRKSVVRLNIFYESFEKYVYEYSPKFDVSEVLSYLGNILGLWVGLSMIAIFEVLEKLAFLYKYIKKRLAILQSN